MYSSTKTRVVWYMGHTCDYLWKEIWVFFNLSSVDMSLLLLTREAVHKLGRNLTHAHANCLLKYSDQIQMKFPTCKHLPGYQFSVFEDKLLHRIHIFVCFTCQATDIPIVHLQQRLCCFWTWRTIQKLYPSHCLLSESCFQLYKSSCGIFPQFKAKFDTDKLLYQVPIS